MAFWVVPQRVGRRRFPPHVAPSTSEDSLDLWHIACMRRTRLPNGELISPPDIQEHDTCNLRTYWGVAPPNIDRARRKWQRANISPISEEQCPPTFAGGTAFQLPSDDEIAPHLSQGTLPLCPPLGLIDSPSEYARESEDHQPTNNARTPKRPAGEFGDSPPQRVRSDSQGGRIGDGTEFRARRRLVICDRACAFFRLMGRIRGMQFDSR